MNAERRRARLVQLTCVAIAGILLLAAVLLIPVTSTDDAEAPRQPSLQGELTRCRELLSGQDWPAAATLAAQLLERDSQSVPARLMHGQALAMLGDISAAVATLDELPLTADADVLAGRLLAASLLMKSGRLTEMEARLRDLLPFSPQARMQLAYLLAITGRAIEAGSVLQFTLSDPVPLQHLFWVAFPQSVLGPPAAEQLERWLQASPTPDPLVLVGLARWHLFEKRPARAVPLLQQALEFNPQTPAARSWLGRALLETQETKQLQTWLQALPQHLESPEDWKVLGDLSLARGDRIEALRAFLEAAQLDPRDSSASYQAGRLMLQIGDKTQGARLITRSEQLDQLKGIVEKLAAGQQDQSQLFTAITLLQQLGRLQESRVWLTLVSQQLLGNERIAQLQTQQLLREKELNSDDYWLGNPLAGVDLSRYALPKRLLSAAIRETAAAEGVFRMSDRAENVGLQFTFVNGHDSTQVAMKMHEFTGGGVAVLDFDLDQWPDLFFPQGGLLPDASEAPALKNLSDQLYWNRGGETFGNITHSAGVSDRTYGQGAAVGDINQDGFPDLYVGNIGGNRLLINNGDGTFTEEAAAFSQFADWTTSCLVADLTGDGLPDLYDVNYLAGDRVYTEICRDKEQIPRSCKPTVFPAATDRFWENQGDGQFLERSFARGLQATEGRGLGVVAFRAGVQRELSLFIANDGEANFFLTPDANSPGKYRESAVLSGLAFDGAGQPQACMGIAAADINNNGETELFVTNFYQESNTLYARNEFEGYDDATHTYGLRESSLPLLGFGTQFLDLDLDGQLDLLIANGHEGDYTDLGIPFRMRPQIYRGTSAERFVELDGADVGPYFTAEHLGRGMAVLDWNRDGRPDACITHLDTPVALLSNETDAAGTFLTLRFVGTASSRDAIGTRIRLQTGEQTIRRELLAGDGYLSSNERCLTIGTGQANQADQLTIEWPSGHIETLPGPIQLSRFYTIVEGSPLLWSQPHSVRE